MIQPQQGNVDFTKLLHANYKFGIKMFSTGEPVLLCRRWPKEEISRGGIALPDVSQESPMGVATVIDRSDNAPDILKPGAIVLMPEYAMKDGVEMPVLKSKPDDQDVFFIDARNVKAVIVAKEKKA